MPVDCVEQGLTFAMPFQKHHQTLPAPAHALDGAANRCLTGGIHHLTAFTEVNGELTCVVNAILFCPRWVKVGVNKFQSDIWPYPLVLTPPIA